MKKIILFSLLLSLVTALSSCEKNPISRLVNPEPSSYSGVWSGTWVVYDDELKTDGNVMLFNEGCDLDFNCTESPRSGSKCIKYSWSGLAVLTYPDLVTHTSNYYQSNFTGFSLISAKTPASYADNPRDLSLGGYTKITFWAKGKLNTNVYLRAEANSEDGQLYKRATGYTGVWMSGAVTADWVQYSMTIDPVTNKLATAKDFIKFIFRYDQDANPDTPNSGDGNGGTVYIDDIQLEK